MAQEKRTAANVAATQHTLGPGPYLAKVVSHLDPTFMGALEVTLLKQQGNTVGDISQTYVVRAAPPFYGSTAFEFMGSNEGNYDDTQKSYGMWFVPPDVGVTVVVIFIDSNPAEGFWIGCVPSRFSNNMVPGIAASERYFKSDLTEVYGEPRILPVAELNRRVNDASQNNNVDNINKAVHPFADRLLEQGLLRDETRGPTSSSARREVPSMVFGISTPGPLDKRNGSKRAQVGTRQSLSTNPIPVSRLGGSQFVMDDGDDQYQRKTSAGEGPSEYVDILTGETGEPTIPKDEHVRIRTRTGHQILLHNSEDLIYISNAKGTAWIELTSDGKIDIYAKDSISIHTENDFNFRADRDINIEAGRNVNIKSLSRTHIESGTDTELVIGANGYITTKLDLNVSTTGKNNISAGSDTNVLSGGSHVETASVIHMNGPSAVAATAATELSTHANVLTDNEQDWAKTDYQKGTLDSIMKRVPMHEPWLLHENLDPQSVKKTETDREQGE